MDTTQTIPFKPVVLPPSSEQRFRTIAVYRSLAEMFDTLGEPSRAARWRIKAKELGWKDEYDLSV